MQSIIQVLPLSAAMAQLSPTFAVADTLAEGTVHASMQFAGDRFYGAVSEALIRGAPLVRTRAPRPAEPTLPRLRAKDLIAELRTINAQVHRIMFQVERAVARLATSG
jgi:hypothetical protein